MAATTLPTLLLGGDPDGDPEETYADVGEGAGAAAACAAWWSAGRCSTRRTATSRRPSTSPPGWCTGGGR